MGDSSRLSLAERRSYCGAGKKMSKEEAKDRRDRNERSLRQEVRKAMRQCAMEFQAADGGCNGVLELEEFAQIIFERTGRGDIGMDQAATMMKVLTAAGSGFVQIDERETTEMSPPQTWGSPPSVRATAVVPPKAGQLTFEQYFCYCVFDVSRSIGPTELIFRHYDKDLTGW